MKTDSQEYTDLMKKWIDDACREEVAIAKEEYLINEDMHGRLPTIRRDVAEDAWETKNEKR